ncbi:MULTISPECIES: DUF2218 domain-containing protein [Psychrobacter]|jgi:hypothetical protein|uniref:DUF2218 domain-containing protein n=1 Tax=Psychrobacter TaxID=497 RepID=UPI001D1123A9|nr:DUF2218 domain-containing protein [Psychrobacter pulmonis]
MLTSSATIQTQNPQQIMNRLCKHWAHKLPVTLSSDKGEIELPMGVCQMYCTDLLIVTLKSDAEQLPKLQQVVSDHLLRMAGKETLVIEWA